MQLVAQKQHVAKEKPKSMVLLPGWRLCSVLLTFAVLGRRRRPRHSNDRVGGLPSPCGWSPCLPSSWRELGVSQEGTKRTGSLPCWEGVELGGWHQGGY